MNWFDPKTTLSVLIVLIPAIGGYFVLFYRVSQLEKAVRNGLSSKVSEIHDWMNYMKGKQQAWDERGVERRRASDKN